MSPQRKPAPTPLIPAPRLFVERRVAFRREADRLAHEESVLLARALDLLAASRSAEERLADLLELIATTAGADRAAVLAETEQRLVAVTVRPDEPPEEAEDLARWLDAASPRPRAARAAAGPAGISLVTARPSGKKPRSRRAVNGRPHYVFQQIPGGGTALGFAFSSARAAALASTRLPPTLARHAAVALALASRQVADQRELADLRGRDAERKRFVSMAAHELRTPLTSLGGYLDLIVEDKVAEAEVRNDFLKRSRDLVGALSAVVSDLLDQSRLDSGNLNLALEPFSAAELAQSVIERLMPQAMEANVALRGRYPSRLRTAHGDRQRTAQILTNLCGNAVKFTPRGGTVEVVLVFRGPAAVYVVRDDGPGISDEDRSRIFERFFRARGVARVTGTGLGLAISREMARAMDGELDVATRPGAGSSFALALPSQPGATSAGVSQVLAEILEQERRTLESMPAAARADGGGSVDGEAADEEATLLPGGRSLAALRTPRLKPVDGGLGLHE